MYFHLSSLLQMATSKVQQCDRKIGCTFCNTYKRYPREIIFNLSVQQSGESAESKDDLIRDRLVVGVINKELSLEL